MAGKPRTPVVTIPDHVGQVTEVVKRGRVSSKAPDGTTDPTPYWVRPQKAVRETEAMLAACQTVVERHGGKHAYTVLNVVWGLEAAKDMAREIDIAYIEAGGMLPEATTAEATPAE